MEKKRSSDSPRGCMDTLHISALVADTVRTSPITGASHVTIYWRGGGVVIGGVPEMGGGWEMAI